MFERLFSRQGMSLERLKSFLRVADAGGIARAAPGDPTQQSQLSRQIGELESFFGRALTERKGRSVRLTDAGERLAVVVREAFLAFEDMAMPAAEARLRFELGAGDSVLHWCVLPRIGGALQRSGPVRVVATALTSRDIVSRLADARLDAGILHADAASSPLVRRDLGLLEYALYVPRRLMRGRSKARPPARAGTRAATFEQALAGVPLALQVSEPELGERLRAAVGGELDVALECETFPQACSAVRSGQYASILPVLARGELPAVDVAELRPPPLDKLATRLVLACHPRLARQRPRAEALFDTLQRELRLPTRP